MYEPPTSKFSLQRFLGMLNYYRRFLQGCSGILDPLHAAVTAAGKNKSIFCSDQCQSSFNAAKNALVNATLLAHLNPFSATSLSMDGSDVALGADWLGRTAKETGDQ